MDYRATYHHEIPNDLKSFPANVKLRIKRAIEQRLLADPLGYGLPLRKSLQGYRKLRVGDYRVIYRIDEKTIVILKIGHRRDVYPNALNRLNKS